MDLSAPVGPEAVGDFTEHDRGADLALRYVVGCRDAAVGEEDEELRPLCLNLLEEELARRMRNGGTHDRGQLIVGAGSVVGQGRVFQLVSSLSDPDRPTQVIADFRCEDRVAAVDGILNVA
jgi:hypothetical protein